MGEKAVLIIIVGAKKWFVLFFLKPLPIRFAGSLRIRAVSVQSPGITSMLNAKTSENKKEVKRTNICAEPSKKKHGGKLFNC